MRKISKNHLRNNSIKIVATFIIAISILVLIYPFLPAFIFWIKYNLLDYKWEKQDNFSIDYSEESDADKDTKVFDKNYLVIPSIGVEVPIVEGKDDSSLSLGAWHRPDTGDPVSGSNMVVTGHRFQYLPPNNLTFYHLDKLVEGDKIIVYWNQIEYDYVVVQTSIVEPDDVEVEDDTAYHVLTLYTCTPLWTADKRLVVVAEPIN